MHLNCFTRIHPQEKAKEIEKLTAEKQNADSEALLEQLEVGKIHFHHPSRQLTCPTVGAYRMRCVVAVTKPNLRFIKQAQVVSCVDILV